MIEAIRGVLLWSLVMAASAGAAEEPRPILHPLFSDHAILQRGVEAPVWGWTEPGARVTVAFAGQTIDATAGPDGKWVARLAPMRVSAEPRKLSVRSSAPEQSTEISDVLVGDVWLCSGQSNMEMGMVVCEAEAAIASADFPLIRLLSVPHRVSTEPVDIVDCEWRPCSPESIRMGQWGGFSAAGFFFGRSLHQELGIPVGLIDSSWGGTIAEAWTSREGLEPLGDFAEDLARLAVADDNGEPIDYWAKYAAWCEDQDPGSRGHWETAPATNDDWTSVEMPRPWEQAGLGNFDGMVWFSREFEAPADWAGKDLRLDLGAIDDADTTWVNGVRVGQVNGWNQPRHYEVPAEAVHPGANVVTVRVLDTGGGGGLVGQPDQLRIAPAEGQPAEAVSLAGPWRMRTSAALADLSAPPLPPNSENPNVTTVLYNGMIAPLVPFALKGAIWYQGESNADRAWQYRRLLPAMIRDWRDRFGVGAFPFYIVQLAAFQPPFAEPRDSNWAELREAQALTAQNLPHCGLAVTIDAGDADDIHPKDKQTVGERLARCALAQDYGKDLAWSGPWYRSMERIPQGIRLVFDHVNGGLTARGGPLTGFAVAGEDRHFVWADAVIEGDTIVVSSPDVAAPVAVRYAWDINPRCNLYNQAGLPAVPFRTDDWPMITGGP